MLSFSVFWFLLYMLLGTSRETCSGTCIANSHLYLDWAWREVRKKEEQRDIEEGGQIQEGLEGERELKIEYLRALERQHRCSHLS